MFLTETRSPPSLLRHSFKKFSTPGFSTSHCIFSTFDPQYPSGSGAALLFPSHLVPYLHPPICHDGYVISQWADFSTPTLFISIYWPSPSLPLRSQTRNYSSILSFLRRELTNALQRSTCVIVGGDFNHVPDPQIDASDSHSFRTHNFRTLHTFLVEFGLTDVFRHHHPTTPGFTRITDSSSARLDFLYISSGSLGRTLPPEVGIPIQLLSDHTPLVTPFLHPGWGDRALHKRICRTKSRQIRRITDFKKASDDQLSNYRAYIANRLPLSPGNDIETLWSLLKNTVRKAAKICLPQRKIRSNPKRPPISFTIDTWIQQTRSAILSPSPLQLSSFSTPLPSHVLRSLTGPTLTSTAAKTSLLEALLTERRNILFQHFRSLRARAASSFDTSFHTSPRQGIIHALNRYSPRLQLDFAIDPATGSITSDPAEVLTAISTQAEHLFSSSQTAPLSLDTIPPEWQEYLAPVPSPPDTWSNILHPPTRREIRMLLSTSSRHKAPGPSGLTNEHWRLAGTPIQRAIHHLFSLILQNLSTPADWRSSILVFLAKGDSLFTGDVRSCRPICLLETLSKLFCRLLFGRITRTITKHNLLRYCNQSVLPNTSCHNNIHTLQTLLQYSRQTAYPLWVFLEDKSKAYDSVLYDALELGLSRLNIPYPVTRFYVSNFLQGRSSRICTSFGLTPSFPYTKGIPQGAIESPLLWILFYDPLLHRLHVELPAISLRASRILPLSSPDDFTQCTRIANSQSYLDDLATFATSGEDMQRSLSILQSFNTLFHIRTNAQKSHLLVLHDQPTPLVYNSATLQPLSPGTTVRYLGIFLNSAGSFHPSLDVALKTYRTAINILRTRIISGPRLRYLLLNVLFPHLRYLSQVAAPLPKWGDTLDILTRNLLRSVFRLHRRTPRSAFHSTLTFNIPQIRDHLNTHILMNLLTIFHASHPLHHTAKISSHLLDHDTLSSSCLSSPPISIHKLSTHPLAPLLSWMASHNIAIHLPTIPDTQECALTMSPASLHNSLFLALRRNNFRTCSFFPQGTTPAAWESFTSASRIRRSRRIPRWFSNISPPDPTTPPDNNPLIPPPPLPSRPTVNSLIKIQDSFFYVHFRGSMGSSPPFIFLSHLLHSPPDRLTPCSSPTCLFRTTIHDTYCQCRMTLPLTYFTRYPVRGKFPNSLRLLPGRPSHLATPVNMTSTLPIPPEQPRFSPILLASHFFHGLHFSTVAFWPPSPGPIFAWTDGSLKNAGTSNVSMSLAAYFPSLRLTVSGRLPHAPASSTTPELWAVLACASCVPPGSSLTIRTDSKAVVNGWPSYRSTLAPRKVLRHAQTHSWHILHHLVTTRRLRLTILWTKGHSRDPLNILVDRACASAHNTQSIRPTPNFLQPDAPVLLHSSNTVDTDPVKYLSALSSTRADIDFLLRVSYPSDPRKFIWPANWLRPPQDRQHNSLFRFRLQSALRILPTNMIQHYFTSSLTSPFCILCPTLHLDDIPHRFMFHHPDLPPTIPDIFSFLRDNVPMPAACINSALSSLLTHVPPHLLYAGGLHQSLRLECSSHCSHSPKEDVLSAISSTLSLWFFTHCWKPHQFRLQLHGDQTLPISGPAPPAQTVCFRCRVPFSCNPCTCLPLTKLTLLTDLASISRLAAYFGVAPLSFLFSDHPPPTFPFFLEKNLKKALNEGPSFS